MNIEDGDHVLVDNAAWFTVGPYAVRVQLSDDALRVSVFKDGEEMDAPLETIEVTP